jgi:3-phenylpropionate/cinnamic acid dioxygenase small subunit
MRNAAIELHHEIEQFLYHEARLLDEGRLREWVELFTDDAMYWMPTRQTAESLERGVRTRGELALFEDDKQFLLARARRLETDLAHSEQPPSRTRHFVTNVAVLTTRDNEVEVHSNILVYQSRLERTENFFVGKRGDRLRRINGSWKIASRKVVLDQTLLPRAVSILF